MTAMYSERTARCACPVCLIFGEERHCTECRDKYCTGTVLYDAVGTFVQ